MRSLPIGGSNSLLSKVLRGTASRAQGLLLAAAVLLAGPGLSARADDTITLHDGKTLKGTIVAEDTETITVRLPGKSGAAPEEKSVLKSRIKAIARTVTPEQAKQLKEGSALAPLPAANAPVAGGPAAPQPAPKAAAPDPIPPATPTALDPALESLIDGLAAHTPEARAAARRELTAAGSRATTQLLMRLHPKHPAGEYPRVAVLRYLGTQVPWSDETARTVAWAACMDAHPEAKREACQAIRETGNDRALRELLSMAASDNENFKRGAAVALREIDDPRVLAGLIQAVQPPGVTANHGEATGLDQPKYNLPIGPGGARMPIYLPSGPVTGVATDIGSPASDLLKRISGKDFGNLPYGWFNWFREKTGEVSSVDRDAYNGKRSLRGRMNAQ